MSEPLPDGLNFSDGTDLYEDDSDRGFHFDMEMED